MSKPKVFISGTSRDLRSYRDVVTEWVRTRGYEPVVQDEFPVMSDYATIVQMLREKLDPCDAVIHLAGLFYGFEPKNRPDGKARRSYTQLEFELAKVHRRQVFRFIAREDFNADQSLEQIEAQLLSEIPGFTAEEFQQQCELQRQHRQRVTRGSEAWSPTARTTGNELYYEFSNHDELRQLLDKIEIKPTLAKPNNLPLVGTLFKGREDFLEQLRSVLVNKSTHIAAVTAKQAIHGLGGVGKTRVAVEYAKRYSHEYTALLFITADSPSNLHSNLANLCGAMVLNLPEQDAREQEVQVAAAIRWLREHTGWFLIIDNVDTPESATEVENLLQRLDTGHVLITSRLSQWGDAVTEFPLDILDRKSAVDFLLERTHGKRTSSPNDSEDAAALASDLGYLPLALEQAGAFIAKHRESIWDYRARWKAQEKKVLEWHDIRAMKYPASVATTWQTSFDQLTDDGRGLLNVLCWLAPDPIPIAMLSSLASGENEPAIDVEDGIADLAEYSLLKWTDTQLGFVEVHGLVQDVVRSQQTNPREHLLLTLNLMNFKLRAVDPSDVRSWKTWIPVSPHVICATTRAEEFDITEPTSNLVGLLGVFVWAKALFGEAETFDRRALALAERQFGSESSQASLRMSNLAATLKDTNHLEEAESLMRRSLAIDEKKLAQLSQRPDSSESEFRVASLYLARNLNNLAQLLHAKNRLEEAEQLMRRALDIDNRIVEQLFSLPNPPDNELQYVVPKLATDLNNLARLLQNTNRFTEAETLFRQALSIDEWFFGPEHPNVGRDLNNLGLLFRETNRLQDAEDLIRRSVVIEEQAYGAEHPTVAIRLGNLGLILQDKGKLEEAEPIMRRSLAILETSFGSNHPEVANSLSNLGILFHTLHRWPEAEPLLRRAVEISEQACGPLHPDFARDLNNLGQLLHATNRLREAEPLMRRVLDIDETSYGANHPSVARDLNNLAQLLRVTNRLEEAESLLRRALAIFEQAYGVNHPSAAICLGNLGVLLQATDRLVEAEPLLRDALAINEQSYGLQHPAVERDIFNLLALLRAMSREAERQGETERYTSILTEGELLSRRFLEIVIGVGRMTGMEQAPLLDWAITNYGQLLLTMGHSEAEIKSCIQEIVKGNLGG